MEQSQGGDCAEQTPLPGGQREPWGEGNTATSAFAEEPQNHVGQRQGQKPERHRGQDPGLPDQELPGELEEVPGKNTEALTPGKASELHLMGSWEPEVSE